MKAVSTQGLVPTNLKPYMGVQFDRQLTFNVGPRGKPRHFRVFTYQAYNAMGCIGPEMNGIAICDDDKRQVICDGLCKQSSGYFGASQEQFDRAEAICAMPWDAFRDFVNGCPNLRMRLEDATRKSVRVVVPPMQDVEFMTAKQKATVLRAWARFVKLGFRQEDFTDALYKHLTLHCSFIAHFNRMTFWSDYFIRRESKAGFLNQFDRSKGCASVEMGGNWWLNSPEYADLNNAMVDFLAPLLPAIRKEMKQAEVDALTADLAAGQERLRKLQEAVA